MPFIKNDQFEKISECVQKMNAGFLDWYTEYQRKFVDNETINETMYEKQMLLDLLKETVTVISDIEQEHIRYNEYCRDYQRATKNSSKERVSRNGRRREHEQGFENSNN